MHAALRCLYARLVAANGCCEKEKSSGSRHKRVVEERQKASAAEERENSLNAGSSDDYVVPVTKSVEAAS